MDVAQELQKYDLKQIENQKLAVLMRYDSENGGPLTRGMTDSQIQEGMRNLSRRFRSEKWGMKEAHIPGAHAVSTEMIRTGRLDSDIAEELTRLKMYNQNMPLKDQLEAIYSGFKKSDKRYDGDTMAFERDNIMLDPRQFDIKHQPFTWREIVPIQNFTPGTAEIAYRQFDTSGEAKDGSIEDGTMHYVDATGEEFFNKVFPFKAGYRNTFAELRRAMFQNTPIQLWQVKAVQRSYETKLQKSIMLGNRGLAGFINGPNVPNVQSLLPVAGADRAWGGTHKTNDEIVADITGMLSKVISEQQSAYGETGFWIYLSAVKLRYITTTRMAAGTDTTIAQFVLQNDPSIAGFKLIHELVGEGTGGTELAICAQFNEEYLQAQVADTIIWHGVQFEDLYVKHPSEMEFGGVVNRYPLAMTQLYDI